MRVVKITCDRCGEKASYRVDLSWRTSDEIASPFGMEQVDLCPRCFDELVEWVGVSEDGVDSVER